MRSLLAVSLLLLLPATASAGDVFRIGTRSATIGWPEPEDPDTIVDGYLVSLSRNGEPEQFAGVVEEPRYTIEAAYGESVVARVRTLGRLSGQSFWKLSAYSPPSPRIHFVPPRAWPSDGLLTLHCAECEALDLREVASPAFGEELPGKGAPWEVLGVGDVHAREGLEVVWFDPTFGKLEVIGLGDDVGQPVAVPNVSLYGREPLGLVDADGDGRSEVVIRHAATGSIEFWKPLFGWLVRVSALFVPTTWELISGRDFDADGTGDLWWQTPTGELEVWRIRNRTYVGTLVRLSHPGVGVLAGIGDFDADGTPDALWRDATGTLTITYLGPGAAAFERQLGWVPEDDLREVRGVADLDGEPGDEILLQHQETLTVDFIHPDVEFVKRDRLLDMDARWLLVDARSD